MHWLERVPATLLVILAVVSINLGSALAISLFPLYGTHGMLFLRMALGGAILMFFMFLAADVWPENNPVNSSHVIEMVAFIGIAYAPPTFWSLQGWFSDKFPQLNWVK